MVLRLIIYSKEENDPEHCEEFLGIVWKTLLKTIYKLKLITVKYFDFIKKPC